MNPPPLHSGCPPIIGALLLVIALSGVVPPGAPEAFAQQAPKRDSLTLEAVVKQVLETYPAIEAAQKGVDAATARVAQARSGYWPRVEAVGLYRRQDPVPEISVPGSPTAPGGSGRTVSIQPNNLYDGHLQVQQTLYDFGQTAARIDQAEAGRTTARRQVEAERLDLAFQAVRAFYSTLLTETRLEVQRKQIDQLERTLKVVRRQQDAGTATEFEVQSTLTRLSAARSRLTRLQSQRQSQEGELKRLLGSAPDTALALSGTLRPSLSAADSASIDPDTLAKRALLRHPSVQIAQAQVRAAQRQVRVVDESDAPSLALSAQGGVKNGYPDDLNEPRLNESVTLALRVPLFEGHATSRRVEAAEAEAQAAQARLTDVRRQVSTRVEQAAAELRASLDQLASIRMRVEQAQRAAQLARKRYEAGTITNLDLLEAETELQRARLDRTEVYHQVIMGRYALQRAAGTLLPFSPPQ